jgi:precorrin isomerase
VASKESAEHMSQKLADSLESLKIVVRCSTTTTDLSKTDFETVQILVTTVNVWRDISHTLGKRCKIFCSVIIVCFLRVLN